MIGDLLIPQLREKYAAAGVRFGSPPGPVAVFPAKHLSVGDLMILDDGDEATVVIGEITHGHFNPYNPELSQEEIDENVSEAVLTFLEEMFALASSHSNRNVSIDCVIIERARKCSHAPLRSPPPVFQSWPDFRSKKVLTVRED